jgi:hypothetical protein
MKAIYGARILPWKEFWQTAHAHCFGACEMHTAAWTFDAAPILEFCKKKKNNMAHRFASVFLHQAFKISLTVKYSGIKQLLLSMVEKSGN